MVISRSTDTLEALRESLAKEDKPLDEDLDIRKTSKSAKSRKKSDAKPEGEETRTSTKLPKRKVKFESGADPSEGDKTPASAKPKKAEKQKPTKAAPKVGKTPAKTKKSGGDKDSPKSPHKAKNVAPARQPVSPIVKKIDSHVRRIGQNPTRDILLRILEGGDLSASDTKKAVQELRATLLNNVPPKPKDIPLARRVASTSPATTSREKFSLAHKLKEFDSLEDAIQEKPTKKKVLLRKVKTRDPIRRLRGSPLRPPQGANVVPRMVPSVKLRPVMKTGPMKEGKGFNVETVTADELQLVPVHREQKRVPSLSYGLERVLFNPGVYNLQDPRSRVFNFDPYLQTIMPVSEFDFNALKQYVTSSRDISLLEIAREEKKKYTGSTSSMTAALAHFHFLLSQWRPINTGILSQNFPVEFDSFTNISRGPSAVFLRLKDGIYAIDADKQFDNANILSMLGKSMEKLLTLSKEDFEKYRKGNSDQISEEDRNEAETFNYTTIGDFLLRSQLDAHDPRLPGTGMFDLKTRAVVSIRMDVTEYEQGMGYEIRNRHGEWESFEREYYDMIRSAFLKYSLQVRMGRMDGIFVAFHNTTRIFGFQYISLPEMDFALHGTDDTTIGDSEFKISLDLLNKALDKATAKYPGKSLRLHFETRPASSTPFMYIFAEPVKESRIDEIQRTNQAAIIKFEQNVLGLQGKTEEELLEEKKQAEWEILRAKVEESMEKDELDINKARAFAEDMIEESEYHDELSLEEKNSLLDELVRSLSSEGESHVEDENEPVVVDEEDAEDDHDEEQDDVEDDHDEEEDDVEDEDLEEDEEEQLEDGSADAELELEDKDHSNDAEEYLLKDPTTEEFEVETFPEEMVAEEDMLEDPANEEGDLEESLEEAGIIEDDAGNESAESAVEDNQVASEDPADADEETLKEEPEQVNAERPKLVENEGLTPGEATEDVGEAAQSGLPDSATDNENPVEVFAMTLTIRNKVNNKYVERPENLSAKDKWTVEYALADINEARGRTLYEATKRRRAQVLSNVKKNDDNSWFNAYLSNLRNLSQKGAEWREGQKKIEKIEGLKVLDIKDGEKIDPKDRDM